jgi:hypothetical protein
MGGNGMRRVLWAVVGVLLAAQPVMGQCRAEVSGRVITEPGKPLAGARVAILPVNPFGGGGQGYCVTDRSGEFDRKLDLKVPGSYEVFAEKGDEGYPNGYVAFYDNYPPPLLDLRCGTKIADVTVRLGAKVAYITQIEAFDAVTGKVVKNASMTLRRVKPPFRAHPGVFRIIAGGYLPKSRPGEGAVAIPSNVDISYEISAPGYVTSKRKVIRLAPLETMTIQVQLHRTTGAMPRGAQSGKNAKLLLQIQETVARIQAWHGPPSMARTDEAEHLCDLTQKIEPKSVDARTLASIIGLMQSKDDSVRMWVAAALGNLGPRAKSAVPVLLKDIRENDCVPFVALTSAATARVALEHIGVKPPPERCGP